MHTLLNAIKWQMYVNNFEIDYCIYCFVIAGLFNSNIQLTIKNRCNIYIISSHLHIFTRVNAFNIICILSFEYYLFVNEGLYYSQQFYTHLSNILLNL